MGSRWEREAHPPFWKERARFFEISLSWPRRLCDEGGVEFFDKLFGIFAERFFGDSEWDAFVGIDALPGFEVGVLVVGGEGAVEGDVVFDHVEPVELGFGEAGSLRLRRRGFGSGLQIHSPNLLVEPLLVAGFYLLREGRERLVVGIDGVADEGDEVG